MIHNQQRYRPIDIGTVVHIEHGWVKTFSLLPHKTVSKKYVWLKTIYSRKVWVYNGFTDEPETQYAELFDILKE